jgi:hypothetical protein
MDLRIASETYSPPEDHSWLGSAHATDTGDSITLDGDKFLGSFADGIVPSGVALGIITATGKYAPYTDAATHGAGSDVMRGHLLTTVDLGGTTSGTAGDVGAALLRHGQVVEANLPTGHGVTTAGKADVAGSIIYV